MHTFRPYRRRINTEEKAKVFAASLEIQFSQFLTRPLFWPIWRRGWIAPGLFEEKDDFVLFILYLFRWFVCQWLPGLEVVVPTISVDHNQPMYHLPLSPVSPRDDSLLENQTSLSTIFLFPLYLLGMTRCLKIKPVYLPSSSFPCIS